jgi:cytochrome b561
MRLRNYDTGYGAVTKLLHWLTVLAIVAQFFVGYAFTHGDLLDGFVDRYLDGEDDRLMLIHAGLGVFILILATVRLLWRVSGSLPAWAEGLSAAERRIESVVERLLYLLLFLIPLSGLALLFGTGAKWKFSHDSEWEAPWDFADDNTLLTVHIWTHLTFFAVVAIHIGLVLKHQLINRDRLLNRML